MTALVAISSTLPLTQSEAPMPWVKLDDKVRNHPKILAAGPLAAWQWIAGLGYASEFLTDGFIPDAALGSLVPNQGRETTTRLTARLLSVGLWGRTDGGYLIHDYHDYNPTAEQVRAQRKAAQVRQSRHRHAVTQMSVTPLSHDPVPSPTPKTNHQEEPGGAAPPPARHPLRSVLEHFRSLYREHRKAELVVAWPKDCARIKPIVDQLGVEETEARMARFFVSTDEWIQQTDYGVGAFLVSVNRLVDAPPSTALARADAAPRGKVIGGTKATAANADVLARALAREPRP